MHEKYIETQKDKHLNPTGSLATSNTLSVERRGISGGIIGISNIIAFRIVGCSAIAFVITDGR